MLVALSRERIESYRARRRRDSIRHIVAERALYERLSNIFNLPVWLMRWLVYHGYFIGIRFLDLYDDEVCESLDFTFNKPTSYFKHLRNRHAKGLKQYLDK